MPESCRSGGDFRALNRRRPPDGCGGQLSLSAINAQRHGLRYRRFGQVVEADCRLFPFNRNARLAPLGAPGPGAGKAMASGRARAVFPRRFSHDPPGYRTPGAGIPPAPGNAPVAAHSGTDPALVCTRTPAGPGSGWEPGPPGHRPAAGRRTAPPSPSLPRRTPAPRPPAANRPPRHRDRKRAPGRRDPTSPPGNDSGIPAPRCRPSVRRRLAVALQRPSASFGGNSGQCRQVRRRQRNSPEAGGLGSPSKGAVFAGLVADLRVAARQLGGRGAGS